MKVQSFTAPSEALLGYPAWRMTMRGEREPREFRLIEGRAHGGALVAKVEGVDSPEAAAMLRGSMVEVTRAAMPRAEAGEVYLADLPGCAVVTAGGVELGTVEAVDDCGAHPLLRVVGADGASRLIPLVPAYVTGVDLAARVVEVDWEADY
jgi:16S rRNA processing protein RimM